jgi:hypothetical protein
MTLITPVGDDEPAAEILAVAQRRYETAITEIDRALAAIKAGQFEDTSQLTKLLSELNKASNTAFEERAKVETRQRREAGIVHEYALDFDQARDEIGRRMARLRAAGDAGSVPE